MELALSWLAVSAGAVACVWLKLHYERDKRRNDPQLETLKEKMDELQSDVHTLYSELSEQLDQLHERVDFTERMFSQRMPAELPAPEQNAATPR